MLNCSYIEKDMWDERWGLTVKSVGYQQVGPGEHYPPPKGHNASYMFRPEDGRILDEYQIVYIIEGSGRLVTKHGGGYRVNAGDAFLLFPGEWHSYIPDKETGWTEYWIGFGGENIDNRVKEGYFSVEKPFYSLGYNELMINLWEKAIVTGNRRGQFFQQVLAGVVNYILGIIMVSSDMKAKTDRERNFERITKAKSLINNMMGEDIDMQEIARDVGMSYTVFRKNFKFIAGKTPSQYLIDLRLRYAKDMLRETEDSIKEIALSVGYNNVEHFSTLFRKRFGMSPSEFRNSEHK